MEAHYKRKNRKVHSVKAEETESDYPLCHITATIQMTKRSPPLEVDLEVDGKLLRMELDMGAALSLVSEVMYHQLWPDKKLEPSRVRLTTYSGAEIPVLRYVYTVLWSGGYPSSDSGEGGWT